jgi:hypothetical protein
LEGTGKKLQAAGEQMKKQASVVPELVADSQVQAATRTWKRKSKQP